MRWYVRNVATTAVVVVEYLVPAATVYVGLEYVLHRPPEAGSARCGVDSCYASGLFEFVVLLGTAEVLVVGLLISLITLAVRARRSKYVRDLMPDGVRSVFANGTRAALWGFSWAFLTAPLVLCGGLELLKL
jgi:hypothetical protein